MTKILKRTTPDEKQKISYTSFFVPNDYTGLEFLSEVKLNENRSYSYNLKFQPVEYVKYFANRLICKKRDDRLKFHYNQAGENYNLACTLGGSRKNLSYTYDLGYNFLYTYCLDYDEILIQKFSLLLMRNNLNFISSIRFKNNLTTSKLNFFDFRVINSDLIESSISYLGKECGSKFQIIAEKDTDVSYIGRLKFSSYSYLNILKPFKIFNYFVIGDSVVHTFSIRRKINCINTTLGLLFSVKHYFNDYILDGSISTKAKFGDSIVRGIVSSDLVAKSVLEVPLNKFIKCRLCVNFDHKNNSSSFGLTMSYSNISKTKKEK